MYLHYYGKLPETFDDYRVSQKFVPLLYKSVFQYDWTW